MQRLARAIVSALGIILMSIGTLAHLQAQDDAITVRIPFPFMVGTHSSPPGTYQFSLLPGNMESSQFLMSVRDAKTGEMEMFAVHAGRQRTPEQRGRLVFRNAAGCSVLAEVHYPGTDTFSELNQQGSANTVELMHSSVSGRCRWRNAQHTVQHALNGKQ